MKCTYCGYPNPEGHDACSGCGQSLSEDSDKTGLRPPPAAPDVAPEDSPTEYGGSREKEDSPTEYKHSSPPVGETAATGSGSTGALSTYQSFGQRFEILELIGEGGMGRVYKAWDRELDKVVALKTIRGEQAKNPELLKRFKQELLLARQITHKNVIRIHDMGESEGIKFFTMEFIVGESLKELVEKKGRLPAREASTIAIQVLGALEEAHHQGVIHRDLKPQNIMVDPEGVARVMDFGIARSVQDTGMTATGTVMGTPDYMSPEQARGVKADAQSDVFSFGVILYEMLTGALPYSGDSMAAKVMARLTQKPRPVRELAPETPPFLEKIVSKCLEPDLGLRYRSVREILEDFEREQVDRSTSLRIRKAVARRKVGLAASLVTMAAVVTAIYFAAFGSRSSDTAPGIPATTLAIVPFSNATTDSSLDWLGMSLAEILTTEVGQSENFRTVTTERVNQILADLRVKPGSRLDPTMLARLAEFSSADTVVSGQYLKLGTRIRIDASVQDLKADRTIGLNAEAPNEDALLDTIRTLAEEVRTSLGLSRDAVRELEANVFRPSSESIQALRLYNEGLQLTRQGNHLEALNRLQAATEEDPNFALAYAALGQAYSTLGYDLEAEERVRTAVDLGSDLSLREKFSIAAIQAGIRKDYDKAIESYQKLAEIVPGDLEALFRLGELHENKGDYDRAAEYYSKVAELDPQYVTALEAMGRVETKKGNPQQAFEPLNQALSLAIQLENEPARGAILDSMGYAYWRMNRPEEALRHYEQALAIRREIGDKRGVASTLTDMAWVFEDLGRLDEALVAYQESLELQREIGDRRGLGATLLNLGVLYRKRSQYDQAMELYKESLQIQREEGNEANEAVCLNNIGNLYLDQGQYGEARTYFDLALRIREKIGNVADIAQTVHNLGEITFRTGRYDKAIDHYLRALELYRTAGDKFGVAIESYSLGIVFGYQGRFQAAMEAIEEALALFRDIGERGFWLCAVLAGYGDNLNQTGRFEEADQSLEEAMGLARELDNRTFIAQILNLQADGFFYRGDLDSARKLYREAANEASQRADREQVLRSELGLQRLAIGEGTPDAIVRALEPVAEEAESLGLRYLSTESSIHLAEALLATGDAKEAEVRVGSALRASEQLGLRVSLAKSHSVLGRLLEELDRDREAHRHYQEASRILEEIQKDAQAAGFLERADLRGIYAEATRGSAER